MLARLLSLLTLAILAPCFAAERPPNILFILADDLGYADLGSYGNTFCDTPNLDKLAAGGMRFTNGYAAAPICSASRAGTLTGKTPARLGFEFVTKNAEDYAANWASRYENRRLIPPIYTLNLPLEEQTIAETLNPLGYTTGLTGKWHVSAHYEHYLGWSPTHGPLAQGFSWGNEDYGAHPYSYPKKERGKYGDFAEGEYPTDALTESAIDFLKTNREKPFFLMISHYYVHVPLGTKCKWLVDKYAARAEGKHNKQRIQYGAFVETLDHYVGQLLDALDALGLAENTLVVFTSDNGGHPQFAFNAPLRGSKWNLYEGGIRVPFIARWPGVVTAGSTSDIPVASTDLFPTFRDVAGNPNETPHAIDGLSILPALRGATTDALAKRNLYWHFPYYHPERDYDKKPAKIGIEDGYVSQTEPQSAVRQGDYKLLYFWEDQRTELYNLTDDVAEQHDITAAMSEKAATMKTELLGYLKRVDARLPAQKQKDTP